MTARVDCGEDLDDSVEVRRVLGFMGSKVLPKLALGKLTLKRNDSEKKLFLTGRKASQRSCSSSVSTRAPSIASSRCNSGRCPSSSGSTARYPSLGNSARFPNTVASLCQAAAAARNHARCIRCPSNDLLEIPGSLMMTGRSIGGHAGQLAATGCSSSSEDPAAEVSPTCSFLGFPSPPQSSRLRRTVTDNRSTKPSPTLGRRKRACRQACPAVTSSGSKVSEADDREAPVEDSLQHELSHVSSIPELSSVPSLSAFSRLRMGKLSDLRNIPESSARHRKSSASRFGTIGVSLRRFGAGFNDDVQTVCLGGLFSEEVFSHYDVDKDGRLSSWELASMLRDHGMCLDFSAASRVMGLIAGPGVQRISLEEFGRSVISVVEKRRGSGGQAGEVLQCVFRSYDANKSGLLEVPEYTQFLAHLGRRPRTKDEWEEQGTLVASCRGDSQPAPLNFPEFVVLVRKVNAGEH